MGTDENGNVAFTETYTPFGMTLENNASNDNQAGFTGHIKDTDTGLTYMQARYYDPVIGRFLSQDPVGFAEGGLGYFNKYAYVRNDPVNMIDPTGMIIECAENGSCTNEDGVAVFDISGIKDGDFRSDVAEAITELSGDYGFESDATLVANKSGGATQIIQSRRSGAGLPKNGAPSLIGLSPTDVGAGYRVDSKQTSRLGGENGKQILDDKTTELGYFPVFSFGLKAKFAPMSLQRLTVHELNHLSGVLGASTGGNLTDAGVIGRTNVFMMRFNQEPARKSNSHSEVFRRLP